MGSAIEWTEDTWNPVVGCSRVSRGCEHCYAERESRRLMHHEAYEGVTRSTSKGPRWTGKVNCLPERLDQPLRWRKPRRIFVNSMSDLFHPDVPDEFIDQVFAVMALAPHHVFQILTKRPERMREYLSARLRLEHIYDHWYSFSENSPAAQAWPLPNVWLGTSVEDQATADERIPHLLQTPAAVRWLSCEPLLGPVDLRRFPPFSFTRASPEEVRAMRRVYPGGLPADSLNAQIERMRLHWVVAGGESGPGARPMHPDWARSLRDQCVEAGVPFFFKQRGAWTWDDPGDGSDPDGMLMGDGLLVKEGEEVWIAESLTAVPVKRVGKKAAGRELDGQTWDQYPEALA